MDAIFGLSVLQNPQIRYKLQAPKNPDTGVMNAPFYIMKLT